MTRARSIGSAQGRSGRWQGRLLGFVVLITTATTPAWAGDATRGAALVHLGSDTVFACRTCHGLDGRGDPFGAAPRLGGQHAAYLAKQLEDFRAGRRPNTQMSDVAATLTDSDIDDITAFFASAAPPRYRRTEQPARAAAGRALVETGDKARGITACSECHGAALEGDVSDPSYIVPALAGQAPLYLDRMLRWWGAARRANDPDQGMRKVAAALSAEDRANVVAYIAGLPPPGGSTIALDPLEAR